MLILTIPFVALSKSGITAVPQVRHIATLASKTLRTRKKCVFLGHWFIVSGSVTSVSYRLNALVINSESPICVRVTWRKSDREGVRVWISHFSPCVFHLSPACDFCSVCLEQRTLLSAYLNSTGSITWGRNVGYLMEIFNRVSQGINLFIPIYPEKHSTVNISSSLWVLLPAR